MYIYETRTAAAIGEKYDEAYRFAASRKKSSGIGTASARLETAENWG